jgi:phosphoribosylamine---glycine ligase
VASSRILIVGSGGREHALARRLARDVGAEQILLAPGNDGTAREFHNLDAAERDVASLAAACEREAVALAVIGPEAPLAAGVADGLRAHGVAVFGPSRAAAQLEASKWFAKGVMNEANVPTARAEVHNSLAAARSALARFGPPWVIKADGLAGGKGVRVTEDAGEALVFLGECLEGERFGAGARRVVIEEFLKGEELSVMAICDGARHVLLTPARDHKRACDGDRGPNTGGMGAVAPARGVGAALEREIGERIVTPMLETMANRGTPFQGVLYAGLMVDGGKARVVEFNVRFGDPETQVVLPLTTGSLAALLTGAVRGDLDPGSVGRAAGAAVAVALVDEGYPERPHRDGRIEGLEAIVGPEVDVIHAATRRVDGGWAVSGGRAAYVVARGADQSAARDRAYSAIARLGGHGWRCRRDIAADEARVVREG